MSSRYLVLGFNGNMRHRVIVFLGAGFSLRLLGWILGDGGNA